METRANYALVGLFTLLAIAAGFGFVYLFGGRDSGARREPVRIVFSGSVSGLSTGSAVLFNGIRVGEVRSIEIMPDDPRRVVATIDVDRATPLKADTRARLEFQGLTGVASIALSGGDAAAGPLLPSPGQPVPTIFADRSDFQDILETAREIAGKADSVLTRVDRIIADSEAGIVRTVRNIERFSQALGDNSEGVNRFLASVGQAADRIGPLAERLEILAADLNQLVKAIDPQRVSHMVANVEGFTQSLADNRGSIDKILKEAAALTGRLNETGARIDATLADLSGVIKAVDPQAVGRIVNNADSFSQTLATSRADVEKAIREASALAEKLNASADRVDNVLAAAENFLGSATGEAGKSAFEQVSEAARSIRVLADNLDKRTAEITTGVNRFTGPGLREYEALAADGRRTLNELNRTLRSLERNPQQLLFGGKPTVPEYGGRR
jgi:phospholipid/cholesterol/gamma-HCH transport system substrate-binding protein